MRPPPTYEGGRPGAAERLRFARIARADSTVLNPLDARHLNDVITALRLEDHARVIDIGCGRGEFLLRLAQRRRVLGYGIDAEEDNVRTASRAAAQRVPEATLVLQHGDARALNRDATYDLAVAMGAREATGGYRDALRWLAGLVGARGEIVVGEGYWKAAPNARLLESLGFCETELPTLCSMLDAARSAGLVHRMTIETGADVHDRYYRVRWANCVRYAWRHPSNPDVPALLAWSRAERERHFRLGGRRELGFGVFVFSKSAC
jgi:SAM-dependent methyltransferase